MSIIGSGLTGLVAAYRLSKDPANKITVFEKDSQLGGMLSSYDIDNFSIEKYYHHIFSTDQKTLGLIRELGLEKKLKWLLAKNGYLIDKKIYAMNTPLDFLKLPDFTLIDFIKLGLLTLKIKSISDYKSLDNTGVEDWIIKNSNKNIWLTFVKPLLESKFGKNISDISAAWFIKRIQIRTNRKWNGEILGYLEGGFGLFIKALEEKIKKNGGEIMLNKPVLKIKTENNCVAGITLENNEHFKADKIIFTGSEYNLKNLISQKPNSREIKYQGTICALLSLKKKLSDIYWMNIRDKNIPFRAIIEHTNFLPTESYNGEHLVYLTYYFQDLNDTLAKMGNSQIIELYFEKLKLINPDFDKNDVNWWKIKKEYPTAPIYEKGYLKKVIPFKTDIKDLYLAGINSLSNYPERSIEGSVTSGLEIAEIVAEST